MKIKTEDRRICFNFNIYIYKYSCKYIIGRLYNGTQWTNNGLSGAADLSVAAPPQPNLTRKNYDHFYINNFYICMYIRTFHFFLHLLLVSYQIGKE